MLAALPGSRPVHFAACCRLSSQPRRCVGLPVQQLTVLHPIQPPSSRGASSVALRAVGTAAVAMKQSNIASFFTKPPSSSKPTASPVVANAGRGKSAPVGPAPGNAKEPGAQPAAASPAPVEAPKRKRLRKAVEDSPEASPVAQAVGLEDQQEQVAGDATADLAPVAASPKRKRPSSRSPTRAQPGSPAPGAAAAAQPAATSAPAAVLEPAAASPVRSAGKKTPAPAQKSGASSGRGKKAGSESVGAGKAGAASNAGGADGSDGGDDDDAISFSASESDASMGGDDEEGPTSKPKKGVRRLKARDDMSPRKAKGGKVDGVGTGAVKEAERMAAADIAALTTWPAGQPVPYMFLADTLEAISGTTKRLEIAATLTSCFRAILASTPADLLPAVYMCMNRVAAAHKGVELGVGDSILLKALADSTGRSEAALKKDYNTLGDLGRLAVQAKGTQRTMFPTKPLTIAGVFQAFKDIAACSGANSQERKRGMIVKLLASSKGNEAGFVMRSLQGKLRIGLADQTVIVSLAHAVVLHKEGTGKNSAALANKLGEASQAVKAAFSECPSLDDLVPALLDHPIWDIRTHCHFKTSVPVKPMLAKPTNGVGEVFEKFAGREFTCEYKYDGERAQIHVMDGGKKVMIFSRNSEDMTSKYPDIAQRIPRLLAPGVTSVVLDGEAVAWDPVAKRIQPFQVLSTRARKDVAVKDIKVHVCVYAFDCLFLNGQSLLAAPLTQRREALYSALKEAEGELAFATTKTSTDVEELETFLTDAVEHATEGLIVKTLNDTYEPAKRSSHWLKLKKDYMEGVGDTFDVVPIGAFYGKGKRTGVYGAYLLAVWDPDSETYQTISKLGTGFSEEQLKELTDMLTPHVISEPRRYYSWGETDEPDVWFDAVKVWEVKAADLSISPKHRAAQGLVDPEKGISIRFPRLIRVRDDKGPEDSTSAEQVADMYRKQAVVKSNAKKADDGDE